MAQTPRFLAALAVRNEGAFLIEWVAWYRMLGFDILVATNDCTDRSPDMLNLLHDVGWLTHITHAPAPGTPPKRSAHAAIQAHPLTAATEWMLICDVDEFLVLHDGDGTIAGFVGVPEPRVHGIGFHWKVFGTGDESAWRDTLQHRAFTRAAPTLHPANTSFKSLMRWPTRFKRFGAHSPHGYKGDWGNSRWIDSEGRKLGRYNPNGSSQRATSPDRVTHQAAQMNHYVLRTPESFALKKGIPSPSAGRDRYTDAFYEKFNRNEETDTAALAFADRFDPIHAAAWAIPGLPRLHHLCCAHYVTRLCTAAGTDPAQDPRHIYHMDMAASLT